MIVRRKIHPAVGHSKHASFVLALSIAWCVWVSTSAVQSKQGKLQLGEVEHETTSKFSHIRIRRHKNVRALMFVRDDGSEVGETRVDLDKPHHLLTPYTQRMFASYLVQPRQRRVLIVGLGGGAMVHFLRHHEPDVQIDVVEIDPVVVDIAAKYFHIKSGDKVNVATADGFDFLKKTDVRYDAIYMDAFLKPSEETDSVGVPKRLKTVEFLKSLHAKLAPGGVVAFNLNAHKNLRDDVLSISDAFAGTYLFRTTARSNVVVIATPAPKKISRTRLSAAARELDQKWQANFSFRQMLRGLAR